MEVVVQALGWCPDFGGLEGFRRGLAITAEWFSDPVNLALYRSELRSMSVSVLSEGILEAIQSVVGSPSFDEPVALHEPDFDGTQA